MKALSIRQPWAHFIIRPDIDEVFREESIAHRILKDVENRTWDTSYRGPVLIHAPQKQELDAFAWVREHVPAALPLGVHAYIQRGGIIGRATLVDVVTEHESPWFTGPYGFVLEDPEPLPFHACRGRLGFFEVKLPC